LSSHVGGIVERAEEGDEVVEEEDAESVRYDEVALDEVDAEEEEGEEDGEGDPSGDYVDGRFVEPVLECSSEICRCRLDGR